MRTKASDVHKQFDPGATHGANSKQAAHVPRSHYQSRSSPTTKPATTTAEFECCFTKKNVHAYFSRRRSVQTGFDQKGTMCGDLCRLLCCFGLITCCGCRNIVCRRLVFFPPPPMYVFDKGRDDEDKDGRPHEATQLVRSSGVVSALPASRICHGCLPFGLVWWQLSPVVGEPASTQGSQQVRPSRLRGAPCVG